MRYLDIARSVATDDERNERTPFPTSLSQGGEDAPRYEKNEIDENCSPTYAGIAALGLDPALQWVHVCRGPIEAAIPPESWDGTVPQNCGVPNACRTLGPCPHFIEHGLCWTETTP